MSSGGAGAGAGATAALTQDDTDDVEIIDDDEVQIIDGEKTEFQPPPKDIGHFDAQYQNLCALHSLNNAVGLNIFTASSIEKAATALLGSARSLAKKPITKEQLASALWNTERGYSAYEVHVLLVACEESFYIRQMSRYGARSWLFQPLRRYIVFGRYALPNGTAIPGTEHYIAVRRRLVIDSNRSAIKPYHIEQSAYRKYAEFEDASMARARKATQVGDAEWWYTPNFRPEAVYEVLPITKAAPPEEDVEARKRDRTERLLKFFEKTDYPEKLRNEEMKGQFADFIRALLKSIVA